ncbi:MAG: SpoIIE family protein phosphatase, partial [Bacteroidota bacterium]
MNGLPIFNSHPQWARATYLACLVAVLVFGSIWIVRFASIVSDENWYTDIDGKVTIIEVLPGGVSDRAGLKVGDVITAINGTPVRDKFDANNYLIRSRGGQSLVYGIIRGKTVLSITVYPAVFGMPLLYLAHVLIGIAFILIGTWVFLRRTEQPAARLYGWSHLTVGFTLLISQSYSFWSYPDAFTTIGLWLSPLSWAVTLGVFTHLLLQFPSQRYVKGVRPIDITLVYLAPLSIVFISVLLSSILRLKGIPKAAVLFGLAALAIFIVQLLLQRKYRLYESVEYCERLPQTRVAIIIGLVFIAGSLAVSTYTSWQAVFLLGLAVPSLFFATIVRYRIFDLYVVVRRGSMYSMLTATVTAAAIGAFFLMLYMLPIQQMNIPVLHITGEHIEVIRLQTLSPELRLVFEKRLFLTFGVMLVAALWWLHRKGRAFLDNRFYRGSYDYKRALTTFSKLSHSYSDTSLLAQAVVNDLVKLMFLKGAAFAVRNGQGYIPLASNSLHLDADLLHFDNESVNSFDTLFAHGHSQPLDNLPLKERFAASGVEFITPVFADARVEALILLGEKQAETNFSREDVELLDNLATNVGDALMTMRFYEGARDKERMRKELEVARQIQLSSLPVEVPDLPGIDVAAESLPAYEVGGDFYEFLPRHDSTTFIIGDVSGKGTSAAMYLARIQGILKTIESYQPSLWELLVRLNTQIFDHIEKRSFVTMAALKVELMRSEVTFLRAGHLPLLHFNALTREVSLHQPQGLA